MKFSIIIINYNGKTITKNCLDSLFSSLPKGQCEIIVVDNASKDSSIKYLYSLYGNKIKIISNDLNLGFAQANNQAARIAQGDYLFFLNNDTIIKDDILPPLEEYLKNEKIGVLSPRLVLEDGSCQEYSYGRFPNLYRLFFGNKKVSERDEIDWVSGAAMIVKQDVFARAGGFDERFFMYFEDVDLCSRIKKLGYEAAVAFDAKVVHLGGRSLKQAKDRKKNYRKSQDYFYKKYYGYLTLMILKTLRFFYIIKEKIKKNKSC